jgi:hypothetical protein
MAYKFVIKAHESLLVPEGISAKKHIKKCKKVNACPVK